MRIRMRICTYKNLTWDVEASIEDEEEEAEEEDWSSSEIYTSNNNVYIIWHINLDTWIIFLASTNSTSNSPSFFKISTPTVVEHNSPTTI